MGAWTAPVVVADTFSGEPPDHQRGDLGVLLVSHVGTSIHRPLFLLIHFAVDATNKRLERSTYARVASQARQRTRFSSIDHRGS